MNKINFWAVIVAAVVAFVLGALWYGPCLFGKAYLEVRAVNPAAKPRRSGTRIFPSEALAFCALRCILLQRGT